MQSSWPSELSQPTSSSRKVLQEQHSDLTTVESAFRAMSLLAVGHNITWRRTFSAPHPPEHRGRSVILRVNRFSKRQALHADMNTGLFGSFWCIASRVFRPLCEKPCTSIVKLRRSLKVNLTTRLLTRKKVDKIQVQL